MKQNLLTINDNTSMYWNEKDQKYFNNIFKNVLMRKNIYFHRNTHLNHQDIQVKVIKLSKRDDLKKWFSSLTNLDSTICYYIRHIHNLNFKIFKIKIDIIFTNIYHRVIETTNNLNDDIKIPKGTENIWIFVNKSIRYHQIKKNDLLLTH
ncbi:MAG: hypothetical protein LBL60_02380 [Mycoplasmataceae bacterium]|jgi:hypothetical protein|nr:hypothetical protein [Mycoplasmataceae bacterium]